MKTTWFILFICFTSESKQINEQLQRKIVRCNKTEAMWCSESTLIYVFNVTYVHENISRFYHEKSKEDCITMDDVEKNIKKTFDCKSSCQVNNIFIEDTSPEVTEQFSISYICLELASSADCSNYHNPDYIDESITMSDSDHLSTYRPLRLIAGLRTMVTHCKSYDNVATFLSSLDPTSSSFSAETKPTIANVIYAFPFSRYANVNFSTTTTSIVNKFTSEPINPRFSSSIAATISKLSSRIDTSTVGETSSEATPIGHDQSTNALKLVIVIGVSLVLLLLLVTVGGCLCIDWKLKRIISKRSLSKRNKDHEQERTVDGKATSKPNDTANTSSVYNSLEANKHLTNTAASIVKEVKVLHSENDAAGTNAQSSFDQHNDDGNGVDARNFSFKSNDNQVTNSEKIDSKNFRSDKSNTTYRNMTFNVENESEYIDANPVFDPDYITMNGIENYHGYVNLEQPQTSDENNHTGYRPCISVAIPIADTKKRYQNLSLPFLGKSYENVEVDQKEKQ